MEPLLWGKGLCKSFGAVVALRRGDLQLFPGEVAALLGDNGAGKSTLVRLLSGAWKPDGGVLYFDGKNVTGRFSVRHAREQGIETVHQDRCLCEGQTLWQNVFVGRHLRTRWGLVDVAAERRMTSQIMEEWLGLTGAGLNPDSPVRVLSGGERQALSIGRAMFFGARLVILDEPTTALSLKEVERVLHFVRRLRDDGCAVLIVSHHVHEAYAVADRFLFMHRGRSVGEIARAETNPEDLTRRLLKLAESRHEVEGVHA